MKVLTEDSVSIPSDHSVMLRACVNSLKRMTEVGVVVLLLTKGRGSKCKNPRRIAVDYGKQLRKT